MEKRYEKLARLVSWRRGDLFTGATGLSVSKLWKRQEKGQNKVWQGTGQASLQDEWKLIFTKTSFSKSPGILKKKISFSGFRLKTYITIQQRFSFRYSMEKRCQTHSGLFVCLRIKRMEAYSKCIFKWCYILAHFETQTAGLPVTTSLQRIAQVSKHIQMHH